MASSARSHQAVVSAHMPARFKAPWLIIVDGPLLAHSVMIDDRSENLHLLLGLRDIPSISERILAQRPRLRLSLFWESRFLGEPPRTALARLPAHDADQTDYLYPAHGGAPAVLFIGKPKLFAMAGGQRARLTLAGDSTLAVLRRHGVPVRAY